jgi:ribonuclease HI
MKVTIYTDGSSRGNPGPGGWGAILITEGREVDGEAEDEVIELGGFEDHTTNNRMELRGAIEGLRHVNGYSSFVTSEPASIRPTTNDQRPTSIQVFTDSEYVKKGISLWIEGWMAKGWKTSAKKPVLNQDLWEELYKEEKRLKDAGVTITWTYVQAHVGIPLNERVDTIATACADSVIDKGATNLQLYRGPKTDYEYF